MDEVEGRLEVDVDHQVPLLLGHTHHQAVARDACVIDQHVDTAEVSEHLLDQLVGVIEVSRVGGIGLSLDAEPLELLDEGLYGLVYLEVSDDDIGALLGVLQCYGTTDTTTGPGDDGHLVFE